MREQSSSFDIARIVRELSEMVGARARKAYQPHYEQALGEFVSSASIGNPN